MKGVEIVLSLLLCVNILVSGYLVYLAEDLRVTVNQVKGAGKTVKLVWDITAASVPAKLRAGLSIGKTLQSVPDYIKGKWLQQEVSEEHELPGKTEESSKIK